MVRYSDQLRLEWTFGGVGEHERGRLESSGDSVLRAVAALEEHSQNRLAEEQPELHQELSRIDAKLQLILELVSRQQHPNGRESLPRLKVRISADRIDFDRGKHDVNEGDEGIVRIYLHPAVPEPLAVPGRISATGAGEQPEMVSLVPLSGAWSFREELSRHVFRHHRRQIAASRAAST